MNRTLLILLFLTVAILGGLHQVGERLYFYWDQVWFDSLMHFLGAVAMGFLFLWLWHGSGLFDRSVPTKKEAMVGVLIFVMLVSFGWEFFEFAYGVANPIGGNYPLDTFHDLLFDFLGGIFVGLIGRNKKLYL